MTLTIPLRCRHPRDQRWHAPLALLARLVTAPLARPLTSPGRRPHHGMSSCTWKNSSPVLRRRRVDVSWVHVGARVGAGAVENASLNPKP